MTDKKTVEFQLPVMRSSDVIGRENFLIDENVQSFDVGYNEEKHYEFSDADKKSRKCFLYGIACLALTFLILVLVQLVIFLWAPKGIDLPNVSELQLPYSYEYLRDDMKMEELDNNVRLVFAIDPTAKTSAASFGVEVGTWHEPLLKGTPEGVAHLLEHAIFLGMTEKERNLFSDQNAMTSMEHTYYKFASSNDDFLKALKVYWRSQVNFKKVPEIYKEVDAVNSEFQLDLKSPGWLQFLQNQYLGDNKKCSYNWFDIGNKETLKHQGIDDEVWNFYKKFYTKKAILVTIIANSDKNLKKQQRELYPARDLEVEKSLYDGVKEVLTMPVESLSEGEVTKIPNEGLPFSGLPKINFIPSKSTPTLMLEFWIAVKGTPQNKMASHLNFVAFFFDEVLLRKLKASKQISDIGAYGQTHTHFAVLTLEMGQTETGRSNIQNVVSKCYSAIAYIKKTFMNSESFGEYRRNQYTSISLTPKNPNLSDANMNFNQNALKFGMKQAFSGAVAELYDQNTVDLIVDQLKDKNLLISILDDWYTPSADKKKKQASCPKFNLDYALTNLVSKPFSYDPTGSSDQHSNPNYKYNLECYHVSYDTFYHHQSIGNDLMKKIIEKATPETFTEFKQNEYIPDDDFMEKVKKFKEPKTISKDKLQRLFKGNSNLWYKKRENIYPTPQISISIIFFNYLYLSDSFSAEAVIQEKALQLIYKNVWRQRLTVLQNDISCIQGWIGVSNTKDRVHVTLTSIQPKFNSIFNEMMRTLDLKSSPPSLDEVNQARVEISRTQNEPVNNTGRALGMFLEFVVTEYTESAKVVAYLRDNDYDKLKEKSKFSNAIIEFALIEGSISLDESAELWKQATKEFTSQTTHKTRTTLVNFSKDKLVLVRTLAPNSENARESAYISAWKFGKVNPKSSVMSSLISTMMYNRGFNYLRTKQQLGYAVGATTRFVGEETIVVLYMFTSEQKRAEVEAEIFLQDFDSWIANQQTDDFEQYKNTLIAGISRPYANLNEEASSDFTDLLHDQKNKTEDQTQNYFEKKLAELNKINIQDVKDAFNDSIKSGDRIVFEVLPTKDIDTELKSSNTWGNKNVEFTWL